MTNRYDEVCIPEATIIRQTDNAGCFMVDDTEVWIPWSQIADYNGTPSKDGEIGFLYVKRWIAEDKDLEYEEI